MILTSSLDRAFLMDFSKTVVELERMAVFVFGASWLRRKITSSTIQEKFGCSVGSPFPENVM